MVLVAVDWSAVTAIATSVLALGLLGGIGAAVFAGQQVREARVSREAQMAAELFRRWNENELMEARRLVAQLRTPEALAKAFAGYVSSNAPEAYLLSRELDYFEQLAALESRDAVDLELIRMLLGPTLVQRWDLWRPAIRQALGPEAYPLFGQLVAKLR